MKILKVKCLAPTRLDNYLMQQFPALNPGRLNKALRENKIKLNGKKQPLSTRVQNGDSIKLFLTDEQLEKGMTEAEAVKKGLIRRDTMWVLAKDTLLGKNYDVAAMRYVPAVPGEKITFKMDTATLKSGSGYEIKVFACEVPYKEYLRDMDAQLTYNLIDKAEKQGKFPGLRVGSLEEINNNAGNWE